MLLAAGERFPATVVSLSYFSSAIDSIPEMAVPCAFTRSCASRNSCTPSRCCAPPGKLFVCAQCRRVCTVGVWPRGHYAVVMVVVCDSIASLTVVRRSITCASECVCCDNGGITTPRMGWAMLWTAFGQHVPAKITRRSPRPDTWTRINLACERKLYMHSFLQYETAIAASALSRACFMSSWASSGTFISVPVSH